MTACQLQVVDFVELPLQAIWAQRDREACERARADYPSPQPPRGLYEAAKGLAGLPWNALLTEAVEIPKCSAVALMLALLACRH